MNIFKKIVCILIAISLCGFGSFAQSLNNEPEENTNEKEVNIVRSIGLLDDNTKKDFSGDSPVKRSEFAKILYKILTFSEEKIVDKNGMTEDDGKVENNVTINTSGFTNDVFFRDDSEEDVDFGTPEENENRKNEVEVLPVFSDVSEGDDSYKEIMTVYNWNIMLDLGKGTFQPDKLVTGNEAIMSFLKLMNYTTMAEYYGGYPTGYITVANRLKMIKGLKMSLEDNITKAQLAKLIFNCFNIEVMKISTLDYDSINYVTNSHITFLTDILKLKKVTGTVTANDITTLSGESSLPKNYIMIDNNKYLLSESLHDSYKYIARKVDVYVTDDIKKGNSEVLYIEFAESDDITVVDSEDINEFSPKLLSYSKNNVNKQISIPNSVPIIYNGLAVKEPEMSMYNINNGSVSVIKSDSKMSAVVIWSYKTMFISIVDNSRGYIEDKYQNKVYTEEELNKKIKIYDVGGKSMTADEIKVDNVATYAENGNVTFLYITNTQFNGTIESMSDDDIKIKGEKYKISKELLDSLNGTSIKVGNSYKFFLDYFGNIAWVDRVEDENIHSAIVVGAAMTNGLRGPARIKAVDFSGDKPVELLLDLADTVSISDENGISKRYNVTKAIEKLQDVKYVKYSINSDEKVKFIEIPLNKKGDNGRMFCVCKNESYDFTKENFFGGSVSVDQYTKILVEASDPKDAANYSFLDFKNLSNSTYIVSAYQLPEKMAPELILLKRNFSQGNDKVYYNSIYAVNKIETVYDKEKEEKCKIVYVDDNGKSKELKSYFDKTDDAGNSCTAFDIAESTIDGKKYEIQKGDIIVCTLADTITNEVDKIWIVYSESKMSPSGERGYIASDFDDKFYVKNSYVNYESGELNIDNVKLLAGDYKNIGNPYKYADGSEIGYGFLYDSATDNSSNSNPFQILIYTTQDVRIDNYQESGLPLNRVFDDSGEFTGVYKKRMFNGYGRTKQCFVYEGTMRNYTVKKTSIKYQPYTRYGSNCSRMIILPYNGIIFINDNRKE